eukprot:EG_transcript_37237
MAFHHFFYPVIMAYPKVDTKYEEFFLAWEATHRQVTDYVGIHCHKNILFVSGRRKVADGGVYGGLASVVFAAKPFPSPVGMPDACPGRWSSPPGTPPPATEVLCGFAEDEGMANSVSQHHYSRFS